MNLYKNPRTRWKDRWSTKSDTTSILPGDIKLLDEEIELRLKEISKNNNIQKIAEYKRDRKLYT